jgi:GDP-L-fucose synthase
MKKQDKILILGANGMVGSSLVRNLKARGFEKLLTPSRRELDLTNQQQTLDYFMALKPQHVFLSAARVGGIVANNTYRAEFILENLQIQSNAFQASFKSKIEKFLFLGSSCIYPKACLQPIKEEYLLTSSLETTNEPYAIAKIAGLKTAENFRRQYGCRYYAVMPTNLYGTNDNFDPENSHVIPGLIARMHKAKLQEHPVFKVWGTGNPRREFLYVDDLADACVHIMLKADEIELPYWINIGRGEDISIRDLSLMIKNIVGFKGKIEFDSSKPDGTPRKLLDVTILNGLGWRAQIELEKGLLESYKFFLNQSI